MRKVTAIAILIFLTASERVAKAEDSGESDVELSSSVMWQPNGEDDGGYVYPPGIPAVLRRSDKNRKFRIEQYFRTNKPLSVNFIRPHISGTWPRTAANDLVRVRADSGWANKFVNISRPECDSSPSAYGYRCLVDLFFKAETPTGTIGVSLGMHVAASEFIHPNSVFWVVVPEEGGGPAVGVGDLPPQQGWGVNRSEQALWPNSEVLTQSQRRESTDDSFTDARRLVVRITLGASPDGGHSGFIMGSGYLARNIKPLRKLFKRDIWEYETRRYGPAVYVVTAAHLFPVEDNLNKVADIDLESQKPNMPGFYYDIHVDGALLSRAAYVVARNIESDVAVLRVRATAVSQLSQILSVESEDKIPGLVISDHIDSDDGGGLLTILGYPALSRGRLVQRIARLVRGQYPTDDTSNFGPLAKFKLEAVDPASSGCDDIEASDQCALAEPGMSGGPILDADGGVVGLTVERPNDTNTLIALDLTSVQGLSSGFATDELNCLLRFNPFDRVLTLINRAPDCDYGHFGSPRPFALIEGEWTIQEVLGFADADLHSDANLAENPRARDEPVAPSSSQQKPEFLALNESEFDRSSLYQFTNGHSIINGHAIINGHTIINGQSIIEKPVLVVNRRNLSAINQHQIVAGFKLNPDSFRLFVPKGVRILKGERPDLAAEGALMGQLIVGTRESRDDHGFTPVYSIREFAIWLHSKIRDSDYSSLMCINNIGTCESASGSDLPVGARSLIP